jgi:predicted hydrocarbon binding protein
MDQRIIRFKHCDARFFPYLEKVLDRLPVEIKKDLLNNKGLQILAREGLHEMCAVRVDFDTAVKSVICFNTRALFEPEHRLIHTIAHQFALYVLGEKETDESERKAEELLSTWGFEKEIEAVRYCRAVSESEGYQIGYEWARKQSKDYLLRHFGLYFDEWNEKGLRRISREQYEKLQSEAGTRALLKDQIKTEGAEEIGEPAVPAVPRDEAIIAGIMAAVKEVKFQDI